MNAISIKPGETNGVRAVHSPDGTIERFLELCHVHVYPVKQVIINEGDVSTDLYYIIKGSVSVQIVDRNGRELVLAYLNPGDFFGEIGLFDTEHKRSAYVRARTRCEIAQISYERLRSLKAIFPSLLFTIASQMANRLCKTSRKVSDLVFTDVKGRVARILLDLSKEPDARKFPTGTTFQITRQELGRIAGCSREMVGRALKELADDHLISVSGKTITVFPTA